MSNSLANQRSNAAAMERRSEARRLQARGLTPREIARRLERSECVVRGYLWKGSRMSLKGSPGPVVSVEEKIEMMQAVYPDMERRDWIRQQMQVWQARRQR